jgi:hypothetical protein
MKMINVFAKYKVKLVLFQTSKASLEELRRLASNGLQIFVAKSFAINEAQESCTFTKSGSVLRKVLILPEKNDA